VAPRKGQSIGWIGTGVMGTPMVRNLLDAGFEVAVHLFPAARSG
jgi:3-hydroxyisobutyrate dehydrogenase-like beta-hydroxyacid dehydrogenase